MGRGTVILLDTHVLVRYLGGNKKVGRRAVAAIERALAADELYVSAISFLEIAMLVSKNRLALGTTVAAFRQLALRYGVREEILDGEIAIAAGELGDAHGDPADRMLVATAIQRGWVLVTADQVLLEWKLRGFRTRDATE